MPRGKNYVNNNKGVTLQANVKTASKMQLCEYGAGCTRPDCIYRHEGVAKKAEVCLPFLAGKCTFKDNGCRKRHPKPDEKKRLLAKYSRTRCRFGDECYTEGCLYLHPRDDKSGNEPNYIEPHHVAFPPLNGAAAASVPKPAPNSAWKAAPLVAPPSAQSQPVPVEYQAPPVPMVPTSPHPMEAGPEGAWNQMQVPMYAPYYAPPPYFDPSAQGHPMAYYGGSMPPHGMPHGTNFNAEAKEFVPGSSMT
jgi:hypothetical protein